MKRSIALMLVVALMLVASNLYAYELANKSGLVVGIAFESDPFAVKDSPDPISLKNYAISAGYENAHSVTAVALRGVMTSVTVDNAFGPGKSFDDSRLSGLGLKLSQGVRVADRFNVRLGGFLDYVYHLGSFTDSTTIFRTKIDVDVDNAQILRTGGIASAEFVKGLQSSLYGGYQTFRAHVNTGNISLVNLKEENNSFIGGAASYQFGKVGLGADYSYDLHKESRVGANLTYTF